LHGRFRQHDDTHPECAIPGEGELPGSGPFKGPGELGPLIAKTGKLDACVVKQAFRYGLGREEGGDDEATITSLSQQFGADNRSMKKLLLALASSSAFLTVKE
jgi:hypothetical protein